MGLLLTPRAAAHWRAHCPFSHFLSLHRLLVLPPAVYRLLTSAIVHVGLLHLVFNMMVSWAWAAVLRTPALGAILSQCPPRARASMQGRARSAAGPGGTWSRGRTQVGEEQGNVGASTPHLCCRCLPKAFLPIATSLERQLGSVQFLWLIGLLCVLGDTLYIGISYLGAWVPIRCAPSPAACWLIWPSYIIGGVFRRLPLLACGS